MRTPTVGDRVAIAGHAVVFIVTSVNPSKNTVDEARTNRKEYSLEYAYPR